jgi:hypothetical protein
MGLDRPGFMVVWTHFLAQKFFFRMVAMLRNLDKTTLKLDHIFWSKSDGTLWSQWRGGQPIRRGVVDGIPGQGQVVSNKEISHWQPYYVPLVTYGKDTWSLRKP